MANMGITGNYVHKIGTVCFLCSKQTKSFSTNLQTH